jgi:hypothetical protein
VLGRAAHRDRERLDLDRLGDEVVRAGADRTHRRLERAERGEHQHRDVGAIRHHLFAELEPGHPLHVEIGDDHVDVVLRDRSDGIGAVGKRDDRETALLEPERDQIDHLALVVDHEDVRHVPFGMYTVKVDPSPGVETMSIQPPCSRMIPQLTERPSPVPSPMSLVV